MGSVTCVVIEKLELPLAYGIWSMIHSMGLGLVFNFHSVSVKQELLLGEMAETPRRCRVSDWFHTGVFSDPAFWLHWPTASSQLHIPKLALRGGSVASHFMIPVLSKFPFAVVLHLNLLNEETHHSEQVSRQTSHLALYATTSLLTSPPAQPFSKLPCL